MSWPTPGRNALYTTTRHSRDIGVRSSTVLEEEACTHHHHGLTFLTIVICFKVVKTSGFGDPSSIAYTIGLAHIVV